MSFDQLPLPQAPPLVAKEEVSGAGEQSEYSKQELFNAARMLRSRVSSISGLSLELSRLSVQSFVLCDQSGRVVQRIPLDLVRQMAESNAQSQYSNEALALRETVTVDVFTDLLAKKDSALKSLLARPNDLKLAFGKYKDAFYALIAAASPEEGHFAGKQACHALGNALAIGFLGWWVTDGYVPANDPKFAKMLQILEGERDQLRDLVEKLGAFSSLILFYQEVSRLFYGLHRPDGSPSIYDEQLISNDVMAMKEAVRVDGDYVDNRTYVDRSTSNQVTNSTVVENAVVDPDRHTAESVRRHILRLVLQAEDEAQGITMPYILANLSAAEELIRDVLDRMQIRGILLIGNRPNGEICFTLDPSFY